MHYRKLVNVADGVPFIKNRQAILELKLETTRSGVPTITLSFKGKNNFRMGIDYCFNDMINATAFFNHLKTSIFDKLDDEVTKELLLEKGLTVRSEAYDVNKLNLRKKEVTLCKNIS